jgi:hypothetical protein
MAYDYNASDYQLDYPDPEPQPPPQQSPLGGLGSIMPSIMSAVGGGGASTGATTAGAGGAAATSGGGAAASGGGGMGSAVAAAGPWAALAAVIIGNETWASKTGHRRGKTFGKKHIKDIMSTEVLNQDIEGRILPEIGIDENTKLSKAISLVGNPISLDFGKTWDRIKDIF